MAWIVFLAFALCVCACFPVWLLCLYLFLAMTLSHCTSSLWCAVGRHRSHGWWWTTASFRHCRHSGHVQAECSCCRTGTLWV